MGDDELPRYRRLSRDTVRYHLSYGKLAFLHEQAYFADPDAEFANDGSIEQHIFIDLP